MTNEREIIRMVQEIEDHFADIVDHTSDEGPTKMLWATATNGLGLVEKLKELMEN